MDSVGEGEGGKIWVPTQESNQGLLHCRRILYQLNYQGSPERRFTGKENSEITVSLPAFPTKENIS